MPKPGNTRGPKQILFIIFMGQKASKDGRCKEEEHSMKYILAKDDIQ